MFKTSSLQTEQPHHTQRPLELLSAEAGDSKRHFLGSFPLFPALGHREEVQRVHVLLPARLENPGDAEEPKVGDHHLAVVVEDVLGLEVLVEDALGVQVSHSLGTERGKHPRVTKAAQKDGITPERRHSRGILGAPMSHHGTSKLGPAGRESIWRGPWFGMGSWREMGSWCGCPSCRGTHSSS